MSPIVLNRFILLLAWPSLEAARYRACASRRARIRSAYLITGFALSGSHSLRSSYYWLRPIGLAFAPLILLRRRRTLRVHNIHTLWMFNNANDFFETAQIRIRPHTNRLQKPTGRT